MAREMVDRVARQLEKLVEDNHAAGATDGQLLERFADRREAGAFETLMQRHGALVYGVGRRVLENPQDAEDVFQAAFLILARKAGALDRRRSIGNWLYSVAYRLALRTRGSNTRRRARERQHQPHVPRDPLAEVSGRELCSLLDSELQRLPQRFRAPLLLCFLEGKTRDEAAQILGWSAGSVKGRLERGRELLRARLRRRGLTLSAALLGALLAETVSDAAPASLAANTARAAVLIATGQALTGGMISQSVATLIKGSLHSMMLTKIKIAAVVILLLGVLGGGAVVANQRLRADKPAATHPPEVSITLAGKEPAKPDPEKPVRLDLFGDPLPEAAIARMGTVRFKVPSPVTTGVYSPDGKVLATGGWYGGIWLWDPETGKRLRPLELESWPPVHALAFSPDGKELAVLVTGSGNKTLTFDVATGKKLAQFDSSSVNTRSIAYAADGKTLLIVSSSLNTPDDEPVVHEVGTGKELYRLVGHGGVVNSVRFTGDGKRIVSTDKDDMIRLWDAATGKEIAQVDLLRLTKRLDGDCRLTAVSHDGKSLALMHKGETLLLWDPDAGKELKRLPSVPLYDTSLLTFTPDGKSLATVANTIRLWDVSSGKEIGPLAGKRCGFDVLALSADGKTLASGGTYEPVCLWETATGTERYRFEDMGTVRSLAFSPTGPVLAIGLEGGVQLWEVVGLGGSDKITVKKRDRLQGDGECLAFSPDGKALASAGYRTDYSLWDVGTGKLRRRVERRKDWIDALVFSADGKYLATISDRSGGENKVSITLTSYFWDVETGKEHKGPFAGFHGTFETDDFLVGGKPLTDLPDGRKLSAAMTLGESFRSLIRNPASVGAMHVSRNHGRRVVVSPDGRLAADLSSSAVTLYELATGTQLYCLVGDQVGAIVTAAFSADGRTLITGGRDQTALVWDLTGSRPDGKLPALKLSDKELEERWADLGRNNARFNVWILTAAAKQAVPFLEKHLQPAVPADAKQLERLISDLDNASFDTRENATKELERLHWGAEAALRKTLKNTLSEETRRRVEDLLKKLDDPTPAGNRLRVVRAVEVLEHIGTPAARDLLDKLAKGMPEAEPTREARAALTRLSKP